MGKIDFKESQADVPDKNDGDIISRKALIKEFSEFVKRSNNSDFAPTPTWNDAVSLVASMPSAEPQRKKGALIKDSRYGCVCSECKNVIDTYHTVRFCTWCGADLISGEVNGGK